MTHPTNTSPRYRREVILPQLKKGAARSGRDAADVKVMSTPLIATGRTQAAANAEREKIRQMLGFLYSTPAYWPSLELFGWKDRGERLHRMAAEGRWSDMTALISDEMLDAFVPTARYGEIADVLRECYAVLTDWVMLPMPVDPSDDAEAAKAVARLRGA
jgi:alkanesulfonate monooxygenase SsuD/methylene tetrahydromethanopterin reductase-like flavin-dependent oxidoreductase (luciferase family)